MTGLVENRETKPKHAKTKDVSGLTATSGVPYVFLPRGLQPWRSRSRKGRTRETGPHRHRDHRDGYIPQRDHDPAATRGVSAPTDADGLGSFGSSDRQDDGSAPEAELQPRFRSRLGFRSRHRKSLRARPGRVRPPPEGSPSASTGPRAGQPSGLRADRTGWSSDQPESPSEADRREGAGHGPLRTGGRHAAEMDGASVPSRR